MLVPRALWVHRLKTLWRQHCISSVAMDHTSPSLMSHSASFLRYEEEMGWRGEGRGGGRRGEVGD